MNKDFIKIIDGAKSGNNHAFEDLYNMTKDSAYFVAYSITKNEHDAMDILQDSYIKAFNNIDTLKQPEVFDNWLNRIVSNNSKNYIAKKKPMLFGDITDDFVNEADGEVFIDKDSTPHEVVESKETSRLVMEIIDRLPEDKRLIVLMYYYQEMMVKEIAEALELPVTTIKYKLLSARQDMKKDIESLEKKGTKLYSLAPLAIISSALAVVAASCEVPVYAGVLSGIMTGIGGAASSVAIGGVATSATVASTVATTSAAAASTVATTAAAATVASEAVKGGFLATMGGKVAATALVVAVIGGGTTTAVVVSKHNANDNKVEISSTTIQQKQSDSVGYILGDIDNVDEQETSKVQAEEIKQYEEIDVNSEIVTNAYSYVPTLYDNKLMPTAYQDKKVEINDLSNQIKLINVFNNIEFKKDEVESVTDPGTGESITYWEKDENGNEILTGWYSFDAEVMHKYAKEFYGEEIDLVDEYFSISWWQGCSYNNGEYLYSEGGAGPRLEPITYITKAYIEDDVLYIYDKYLLISQPDIEKDEYDIYKDTVSEVMDKIGSDVNIHINDIDSIKEYVLEEYEDKMSEYKHTFKKNANGEYYWVSTEPVS